MADGLCLCGCGERTNAARVTDAAKGWKKGEPLKYVLGHSSRVAYPRREPRVTDYVERDTGYGTPCWLWQGVIAAETGYGQVGQHGKKIGAHRWYYETHKGPIPEGLTLDHLCRVRACVNPDHLEPVTHAENVRRSPATKLSAEDVEFIRTSPLSNNVLAERFGLNRSWVWRVRNRKAWTAA